MMIEEGRAVPEHEGLVVLVGGEYADEDLVSCGESGGLPLFQFEARFIERGGEVYR